MKNLKQLRSVTSILLDSQRPAYSLRPEVVEMATILVESQTVRHPPKDDIADGETRTPGGLALSRAMAAMCADDVARTIEFIRGLHSAILDIRKRLPDRPARVLYAGCGPFATLAVPLMAVFSADEATFTLLDVHSESIASAESIVGAIGVAESVASFETIDAGSYDVHPDEPPDIIVMEIMRACLDAEPQVSVTRHLLKQAPEAILVPEEIRIDLTLVDASREFDAGAVEENRDAIPRDRVEVATVFVLNRETVASWHSNNTDRLPAGTARLPASLEPRYQAMLFTFVRTHRNHILKDYDSGLTSPKLLSIEDAYKPGDEIQFYYELGSHPKLTGEVCRAARLDAGGNHMPQLPTDCELFYRPDFLGAEEAAALLAELVSGFDVTNKTMKMADGSDFVAETGTYVFADPELTSFDALPEVWGGRSPWTESLAGVRDRIEEETGIRFQVARCVYYKDGSEGMDFHQDLPAYGPTDSIASLSLGAVREFVLRSTSDHTRRYSVRVAPGSLFFMGKGTQDLYEHGVPRDESCTEPRLNITFRMYGLK